MNEQPNRANGGMIEEIREGKRPMPLVLVHNDVVANLAHVWNDVEGVRYHYPSKYQGKIKTGGAVRLLFAAFIQRRVNEGLPNMLGLAE